MSLLSGDLTTPAVAKSYIPNAPNDTVLSGLITRISSQIRSLINRQALVPTIYTQQFSGQRTRQLVLPEWPLLTLSSLKISGVDTPIAPQLNDPDPPSFTFGYRFQPWSGIPPGNPAVLDLIGFSFLGGLQNVVVNYTAGYQVTNEAQTIPATPFQVLPTIPFGSWATDQGVTYVATGVALTAIASGTPTVGQYLPPNPNAGTPRLYYTFALADVGKAVLISYGFIPGDLEQAALDLISERSAYRTRVGIRSQSLAAQETITYDTSAVPAYIKAMLMPYTSVLPPAIGAPV